MSFENIVQSKRLQSHAGLADMDVALLKQLRNRQMKNCFRTFEESRYRMENVAKIRDTEFINDAAARTVSATWFSLKTVSGPIVWIANGSVRSSDYTMLRDMVSQKVEVLICVGDNTQQLQDTFFGLVPIMETAFTIEEAVHKAFYNKREVHRIIFSPACDEGDRNEEWGRRYIHEINEL